MTNRKVDYFGFKDFMNSIGQHWSEDLDEERPPPPVWQHHQHWFDKDALVKEQERQTRVTRMYRVALHGSFSDEESCEEGSQARFSSLSRMRFHELVLGNRHEGRFLQGNMCGLPYRSTAVQFLLGDDDDVNQAIKVAVYNMRPSGRTKEDLEELFPSGCRIAIKEPYFKRFMDGMVGIRVENPQDIVFFSTETIPKVPEDPKRPSSSSSPSSLSSSQKRGQVLGIREKGNELYRNGKYTEALALYEICVERDPEDAAAHRNISAVHMATKEWLKAWTHAKKAQELDPSNTKSHYRRAYALLMLGCYEDGAKLMEDLEAKEPESKLIRDGAKLAKELLRESRGNFSIEKMHDGDQSGKVYADYVGPVGIKHVGGKGRGLVTTKKVHAGELLAACNPLACGRIPMNELVLKFNSDSEKVEEQPALVDLVRALHSKCSSSILAHQSTSNLYDGSKKLTRYVPRIEKMMPPQTEEELMRRISEAENSLQKQSASGSARRRRQKEKEKHAIESTTVDMDRLRKVAHYNSLLMGEACQDDSSKAELCVGIWTVASFVNHSCIPNANFTGIKDFLMLRAGRDIEEGEEILHSYTNVMSCPPCVRREPLKNTWGFVCDCKRCVLESTQLSESARRAILKILLHIPHPSAPSVSSLTNAYTAAQLTRNVPALQSIIAQVQDDLSHLESALKACLGSRAEVKWCQMSVVHAWAFMRSSALLLQDIDANTRSVDKLLEHGLKVISINLDMLKMAEEVFPGSSAQFQWALSALVHGKSTLAKARSMENARGLWGFERGADLGAAFQTFEAKLRQVETMAMAAVRSKFGRELTDDNAKEIVRSTILLNHGPLGEAIRRRQMQELFALNLAHLFESIAAV